MAKVKYIPCDIYKRGISEDELERQINEIGEEVQKEHSEAFTFPLNPTTK